MLSYSSYELYDNMRNLPSRRPVTSLSILILSTLIVNINGDHRTTAPRGRRKGYKRNQGDGVVTAIMITVAAALGRLAVHHQSPSSSWSCTPSRTWHTRGLRLSCGFSRASTPEPRWSTAHHTPDIGGPAACGARTCCACSPWYRTFACTSRTRDWTLAPATTCKLHGATGAHHRSHLRWLLSPR